MIDSGPLRVEWQESLRVRYRAMGPNYIRYLLRRCLVGGTCLSFPLIVLYAITLYVRGNWPSIFFLFQLIGAAYLLTATINVVTEILDPRRICIEPGLLRIGFGSWPGTITEFDSSAKISVEQIDELTARIRFAYRNVIHIFGMERENFGTVAAILNRILENST